MTDPVAARAHLIQLIARFDEVFGHEPATAVAALVLYLTVRDLLLRAIEEGAPDEVIVTMFAALLREGLATARSELKSDVPPGRPH